MASPTPRPPQRTAPLREVQYETRSLRIDVTVCPACGGSMKIVAALTDPHSIRTYLECGPAPAGPADRARASPSAGRARIRQLKMRHEQVRSEGRGLPEGHAVDLLGCCDRFPAP